MESGHYTKERYKCLECGASARLQMCSGCCHALFCGKECQSKAWNKGHKRTCKAPVVHIFVENHEGAMHDIAQEGFIIGEYFNSYPVIVVRDPKTGRVFDMIRNDSVVFFELKGLFGKAKLLSNHYAKYPGTLLVYHNRQQCPDTAKAIALILAANKK